MNKNQRVAISGVGMTPFGKFPDHGVRSLTEEAMATALKDAGASVEDVGFVTFGNAMSGLITGQECVRGEIALRHTGLLGKPIVNVENACASGSTAIQVAWQAIKSGTCEVAVAIGAEKLTHEDKTRAFLAMESAVDVEELAQTRARQGNGDQTRNRSMFMDIYAEMTRDYMQRSGATANDFAEIAVKSHKAGALNPKAQFRDEVTVDQVLQSRLISEPLTLLMCSPIGDGAAVIVLTSAEWAKAHGADAVFIDACALTSGKDHDTGPTAATRAAAVAYEQASIGPEDVDVIELHDATAPAELILYEDLGLCAPGDGPALLRSGATQLGGKKSVNASGGLLSKGHPVGASGCAQIVELTEQLRGRAGKRQRPGARVALAENGGGFIGRDTAAAAVTILSR